MNADTRPELLALDWGTSSLRAFLLRDGALLDTRHSAHGIQHLPASGVAGFEQAFAQIAGDWLQRWPQLPVVASGMVGSAQGWREAPYVTCPATIVRLAAHGVGVASGLGGNVLIAPGVLLNEPAALPDVMRGEEIQIAGALVLHPEWAARACFVLPGTHSKWVQVENGEIRRFASYLTGELFAVLRQHSILGRLMPGSEQAGEATTDKAEAFRLGLTTARDSQPGDFTHQIFAARTLGLTNRLPAAALPDFLSGLLIGHELVSGLATLSSASNTPAPLILIGEPTLCRRYALALEMIGSQATTSLGNTAPVGLWEFANAARAAGLLASNSGEHHA